MKYQYEYIIREYTRRHSGDQFRRLQQIFEALGLYLIVNYNREKTYQLVGNYDHYYLLVRNTEHDKGITG
jgi:hypothetical protein